MKFAVANQFFAIADQAGVDYTNVLRAIREDYPRAADLPGPGFAAGPCLFKDTMQLAAFTSDHFPMGQAAMQINEGMPAYIVSALERRHGTPAREDRRHPGHGVQGGVGRHPRFAQLQAPEAPGVGGRDGAVHGPVRARTRAWRRWTRSWSAARSSSSARRTAPTGHSISPVVRSSTSGTPPAEGSGSSHEGSWSPAPPGSSTATSWRSCSRPATRCRRRQLQQVRPRRQVLRRPSRATGSSRATPRTSGCSPSWRRTWTRCSPRPR